jgi:hypothetical protein
MATLLHLAAVLTIGIGIVHSVLGERYILIRLFRRDNLPELFGGTEFTKQTLRFVWHLAAVAWWGLAAILIVMAQGAPTVTDLGAIVGVTFLIHFVVALIASKGRHFSWLVFLAIGVFTIMATRG